VSETVQLPNTPLPVWLAGYGPAMHVQVDTGSYGGTAWSVTPDWLGAPHIIPEQQQDGGVELGPSGVR
jgi:hypothetical protein